MSADPHAQSVVVKDLHLVGCPSAPGHHRMRAARVVADHSADRRVPVRRGVRRERRAGARVRAVGQLVVRDARLDAGHPALRIDLEDRAHVPRGVDDDRALVVWPERLRPRAAEGHRRAVRDRHPQAPTTSSASRGHTTPEWRLAVVGAVVASRRRDTPRRSGLRRGRARAALLPRRPRRRAGCARDAASAASSGSAVLAMSAGLQPQAGAIGGASSPPSGRGVPAKTASSTRTWSWKCSR